MLAPLNIMFFTTIAHKYYTAVIVNQAHVDIFQRCNCVSDYYRMDDNLSADGL